MTAEPFGSRLLGPVGEDTTALRRRVQVLLTVTLVVANLIGAAVVAVLSVVVLPGLRPTRETLLVTVVAVPAYVLAAIAVGAVWGTRWALRDLRWTLDDTDPTHPTARRAALRVPWNLTVMQAVLWAVATVLFTVLIGLIQPDQVYGVGFTVSFAGIVVCANAYLLSEFALRPVSARALSGSAPSRVAGAGVLVRTLLFWALGTGVPVAGVATVAIFALLRPYSTTQLAVTVLVLALVALLFGLLVMIFSARNTVAPIHSVRTAMDRVQRGDLTAEVPVYDGTELGMLQAGFNGMVAGLRDRERIHDLFGRHVGQEVADVAVAGGADRLGGEVREVAVVFVDLVGSTTLPATHPAPEVVNLLNRFYAVVVDEIHTHHGLINKFMGDAALALFGAPTPLPNSADHALAAARAIARRLPTEVPECAAGIGIAYGPAVAGNIGSAHRFEYTAIGDPVNEAARLTELAKSLPSAIAASATTITTATQTESTHWHAHSTTTLRGRTTPTTVYTLASK